MIGPYKESNKYKLEAEVASLRARCSELNEACSAKQVLIDHTASDLRDMRDLYEREKGELRAELSQADFDRKAWKAECFRIEALLREARAALSQPAATGEVEVSVKWPVKEMSKEELAERFPREKL